MSKKSVAGWIALAGSIWVILMGIGHFPMAYEMVNDSNFASLPSNAADLLILLFLCIGILLIFVGGLSLYFSFKLQSGERVARIFFIAVSILFLGRTILELIYPVSVPEPNLSVLVNIFLLCLMFSVSTLLAGTAD